MWSEHGIKRRLNCHMLCTLYRRERACEIQEIHWIYNNKYTGNVKNTVYGICWMYFNFWAVFFSTLSPIRCARTFCAFIRPLYHTKNTASHSFGRWIVHLTQKQNTWCPLYGCLTLAYHSIDDRKLFIFFVFILLANVDLACSRARTRVCVCHVQFVFFFLKSSVDARRAFAFVRRTSFNDGNNVRRKTKHMSHTKIVWSLAADKLNEVMLTISVYRPTSEFAVTNIQC